MMVLVSYPERVIQGIIAGRETVFKVTCVKLVSLTPKLHFGLRCGMVAVVEAGETVPSLELVLGTAAGIKLTPCASAAP
jgi:hypothetical protein